MELAYARSEPAEHTRHSDPGSRPAPEDRPCLTVVPDLPPSRPSLPQRESRRPSRRAVVRAQVWGVPVSTPGQPAAEDAVDAADDVAGLDRRIAEAVRLLSGL